MHKYQRIKPQNRTLEFRLNRKNPIRRKRGLTLFLPAISPECSFYPLGYPAKASIYGFPLMELLPFP